jgi:WD40 repeat protein
VKRLLFLTLAGLATAALAQSSFKLSQSQIFGLGTLQTMKPSPDGKWLASAGARGLVLWDAKTGKPSKVFDIPSGNTRSLEWTNDSKNIITGSGDGVIRLWNSENGQGTVWASNLGDVSGLALSKDGKYLAAISGENLRIFDAKSAKRLAVSKVGEYSAYGLSWSNDNNTVAVGSDNDSIGLFDVSKQKLRSFKGHSDDVTAVAFSPDGKRLASSGDDDTLRVWDVASGKQTSNIALDDGAYALAWSADGKRIAGNTNYSTIEVWDIASKQKSSLTGHKDSVKNLTWMSDGKLYSSSDDQSIKLWNVANKQAIQTFDGHVPWLNSLAISGNSLVVGSYYNDVTLIFNRDSGEMLASYPLGRSGSSSFAISPDGKLLANSNDETVRIIDVATGRQQAVIESGDSSIYALAWSPSGTMLATGLADGSLLLWDVATGKEISRIKTHNDTINALVFGGDGKSIVTVSDDGTARVFKIGE